jgi:hypothetical protein
MWRLVRFLRECNFHCAAVAPILTLSRFCRIYYYTSVLYVYHGYDIGTDITIPRLAILLYIWYVLGSKLWPETGHSEVLMAVLGPFRQTVYYLQQAMHTPFISFSVKIKLTPCFVMPLRHTGKWRHSSTIVDLGTRWSWVVSFTPKSLYPQYSPNWRFILPPYIFISFDTI